MNKIEKRQPASLIFFGDTDYKPQISLNQALFGDFIALADVTEVDIRTDGSGRTEPCTSSADSSARTPAASQPGSGKQSASVKAITSPRQDATPRLRAADGPSYQEALAAAEVVIREWIETARELGRPIPEPRGRLLYAFQGTTRTE